MIGGITRSQNSWPSSSLRSGHRDARLLRSSVAVFSALFAAIATTGGAIQAADGRFKTGREDRAAVQEGALTKRAGYLRVVVDPWAEVFVDGESVVTTPTAQSIPLSPGKHYLRFQNPYFLAEQREVNIRANQTVNVAAKLTPLHKSATREAEEVK